MCTLVLASALAFLAAGTAKADSVALLSFSGGTFTTSGADQLYGWYFDTSAAINVTALGVGDTGLDGLVDAHDVGILRVSDEALLVSTTIPAGLGATLFDGFRYLGVGPFALAAGSYLIVMTMPEFSGDTQSLVNTIALFSPPVTFVNSAFGDAPGLGVPPAVNGFNLGLFGPNFTFTSAVPEPASAALMIAGGIGLMVLRRRR